MMSADIGNVILRLIILFFAAGASEIALSKKLWAVSALLFGVWLTFFRLTFYRVTSIYLGVFSHELPSFAQTLQVFVQGSPIANITDFAILVGTIGTFRWVAKIKNTKAKNNL